MKMHFRLSLSRFVVDVEAEAQQEYDMHQLGVASAALNLASLIKTGS